MMNQPMARVVKLEFRDQNPKVQMDTSAFVVHLRAPDGEIYEHPLENGEYLVHNPTLQFMALNNFKPSDIEGTAMNVEDWQWLIPVAPDGDGGYLLAANVLEGGVEALEDAEWFVASDDEEASDSDHSGPQSGPGPDPGTGNRGGVDHEEEGGVEAELADEDSDAGVEVTVK